MANVGLSFTLSANAAGMSRGINAGVVELEKLGLQAKKTSQDVAVLKGIEIGRVFISSVRAVVSTFERFTSGASSSIDQANKLSRALGITFGELRQLQLAADLSGASSEQLANAFTRAQVTITKAGQGAPQATAALRALGLSVSQLAGLSASEQFQRIAASIAGIQDPARRAAAAVEVFGRSGAQLLPVFQDLAKNLKDAQGFFGAFKSQLTAEDARNVEAINDAFKKVNQAVTEVAGKILAQLSPALLAGAQSITRFLQNLDISQVSAQVASSLQQVASVAQLLGQALGPALQRPIVAIATLFAFINRQQIANAIGASVTAFRAAQAAAAGYSVSAGLAAASTTLLKNAIRGLVASTGIGLLAVGLGLAAEAAVNFATSTGNVGQQLKQELAEIQAATSQTTSGLDRAAVAASSLGRELQAAFTFPAVSPEDLARDSINAARSAFAGLARELGGLVNVPKEYRDQWTQIELLISRANTDLVNGKVLTQDILTTSDRLVASIQRATDARRAEADAIKAQQDAAKAAQDRVRDLQRQGLGAAEQSRLKLSEDLLQVEAERRNAEAALAKARADSDGAAIRSAQDRLGLVRQAADAAREQDRQRQLQARGIDANRLRPTQTLTEQLQQVRDAFRQRLINPEEFGNALRSLTDEGVRIRRELERELSRPTQQALRAADIRSQEGIAQFFQTARQDPALDQRRQQLQRLQEIRDAVQRNQLQAVNI